MRSTRTSFAIVVVVLLAAGLAWWWSTRDGERVEPAPAATGAAAPAPAGGVPVPAATNAAVGDTARSAATVGAPPAADGGLVVRGRCLAVEADAPLGGVDVRVTAPDADGGTQAPRDAAALAHGASAADGRFELRVVPPADVDLQLHLAAPGRARMSALRRAHASGDVWDLGDVRLPGEARVRGEVVDATGAPVPEAVVVLAMVRLDRPTATFREQHRAPTDARGAFVLAEPVAAGEWYVRVSGTGLQRSPPTTVVPPAGEHTVRVEVERTDPAQAIRGVVVGEHGVPVAGVELTANGDGAMGSATSRADGTFTIHRGVPMQDLGRRGVALSVTSATHDCVQPPASARFAWGQRDVQVVMAPLTELVVRAVDAAGATVPGRVIAARLRPANDTLIDLVQRDVRASADGAVRLSALRAGAHVLWLRPHDERLALLGPAPFTVPRGEELRLAAVPPVLVEVRVTAAGAPVAGSTVELLVTPSARAVDPEQPAALVDGTRADVLRGESQLTQARARTAADGRVVLPVAPGRYLLRVRGTGHLPLHRELAVAPGLAAVDVAATTAAVLHGRLEPAAAVAALWPASDEPSLRMLVTARPPNGAADVASAPVARDGTFTLGPLPPGALDVAWVYSCRCNAVHVSRLPLRLGTIDAPAAGGVLERTFTIGDLLPGTIDGGVALDGAPLPKAELFLRTAPRSLGVRVHADDAGRFTALVPPGDYHAALALPAVPGPGHVILPVPGRWTVRSGATTAAAIDARVRTLRLVLQDGAGGAIVNARVRLDGPPGYARPGSLATDATGAVVLTPAPYGSFVVVAGTGAAEQRFGPIEMPDAASEHSLELRAAPR